MVKCKKIQELILTDYLDGEMEDKSLVEQHLASCVACKEFLALARQVVEPLENAQKSFLSQEEVWSRIQEEISAEEAFEPVDEPEFDLWERLISWVSSPRPVFAMSTFAVVIVSILVFSLNGPKVELAKKLPASQQELSQTKAIAILADSQEEYLAYLFNEDEEAEGYGTSMETYFL